MDAANYLLNQMEGVSIRKQEPESRNGGATELHVSHVLSDRLSSRPKGWSKETLKHFAPILANGSEVRMIRKEQPELTVVQKLAEKKVRKKYSPGIPSEVRPIFLDTGKQGGWYMWYNPPHQGFSAIWQEFIRLFGEIPFGYLVLYLIMLRLFSEPLPWKLV